MVTRILCPVCNVFERSFFFFNWKYSRCYPGKSIIFEPSISDRSEPILTRDPDHSSGGIHSAWMSVHRFSINMLSYSRISRNGSFSSYSMQKMPTTSWHNGDYSTQQFLSLSIHGRSHQIDILITEDGPKYLTFIYQHWSEQTGSSHIFDYIFVLSNVMILIL